VAAECAVVGVDLDCSRARGVDLHDREVHQVRVDEVSDDPDACLSPSGEGDADATKVII
jgi:hypothetical protein